MINIVFAGIGGQNLRLASKILSVMSISRGWNACTLDLNPQVSLGQSWKSFVRIPNTGENPLPPFIMAGCADLIIAFDPYEAARSVSYLKQSGTLVTATTPIQPVPSPSGLRRYDVNAVLKELQLSLYNGMAQNVAAKRGVPTKQARLVPVNDSAFTKAVGSENDVLAAILLSETVRIGCLPFTVKELCNAISACVRPEFVDVNLQTVGLVMSV